MYFFVVATFLSSILFGVTTGRNLTLADVYGAVPVVTHVDPWHLRSNIKKAVLDDYLDVRQQENCVFPLEVVLMQDCTDSFTDDFNNMLSVQLPLAIEALSESHPESTWSVVSFRDKPVWSLGDPEVNDWCVRFDLPLTSDTQALYNAYESLVSDGGADPQENQFGAILAGCQSNTIGWSNPSATRLIVVITDAPPHFEQDGYNHYGMSVFSGIWDEANSEQQCLAEYYPSPYQVRDALAARKAYLASIVYDGDWWNGLVRGSWEWTNAFIGQTPEFVGNLGEHSTLFWESLAEAIRAIELIECGIESTDEPILSSEATESIASSVPTTSIISDNSSSETSSLTPSSTPYIWSDPMPSSSSTATLTTSVVDTTSSITSTKLVTLSEFEATQTEPPVMTTVPRTFSPVPTETPIGTTSPRENEETSGEFLSSTIHECPPCPPEGPCGCPEVEIKLRRRPKILQLNVENY